MTRRWRMGTGAGQTGGVVFQVDVNEMDNLTGAAPDSGLFRVRVLGRQPGGLAWKVEEGEEGQD